MRRALHLAFLEPCELDIKLEKVDDATHVMVVESPTPTFGPQPFLALKTADGGYYHDNFDIDRPFHRWQYVFDADTFPLRALAAVGVAANNAYGTTTVSLLDPATGKFSKTYWNLPS